MPSKRKYPMHPRQDERHFEQLWNLLPEGSPIKSHTREDMESLFLSPNRSALTKIDPTRKLPYSVIFSQLFADHPIEDLVSLIQKHHLWLTINNPDGLNSYQKQLLTCAYNYQQPGLSRVEISDIIDYLEATQDHLVSRAQIRELAPDLFKGDTGMQKDKLEQSAPVYFTEVGPAHRTKSKRAPKTTKK